MLNGNAITGNLFISGGWFKLRKIFGNHFFSKHVFKKLSLNNFR